MRSEDRGGIFLCFLCFKFSMFYFDLLWSITYYGGSQNKRGKICTSYLKISVSFTIKANGTQVLRTFLFQNLTS